MTEFSTDLVALICAYNEEDMMPDCLASLKGKVDRIVLADGRYKAFPGEGGPSTDRTLEIAADYDCDIIPSLDEGWENEHEKRTALVRSGRMGDEYLVIDADERLVGGNKLRDYYGDYLMSITGIGSTPGETQAVRLFAHRNDLVYRWHFGLFAPSGAAVLRAKDRIQKITAEIHHVHNERSEERIKQDKEYEAYLEPYEAKLGAYGYRLRQEALAI